MTDDTFDFTGCSLSEPYALQVLGNEMEPEFPDQCIVVIRPEDSCVDGMHVFVEVEGVRWFRQYRRDATGRETLVALNDLYPEIDLTGLEWRVLGVIIQRNIRRQIKHYRYEIRPPTTDSGLVTLAPSVLH
ncbi:MAG: S24 family peptidase [Chromatiaceae bacterium]|nr:S24 family peptidase [Chromatiaceae bacterium]